jgi:hypothetical protein
LNSAVSSSRGIRWLWKVHIDDSLITRSDTWQAQWGSWW